MKTRYILCFVFLCFPLFGSGELEKPTDCIDIGIITILMDYGFSKIELPYYKPDGIDIIPNKDSTGIILYKLIGDGKVISPKKKYFSNNEAIDHVYTEKAALAGSIRYLEMTWDTIGLYQGAKQKQKGIYYETVVGRSIQTEGYFIPYGTREVYLTYSIRFPPSAKNNEYTESEKQTVKMELAWP